ncbi:MAG: fumarate reductase [Gracilibacter sp. BRH_c7a]|nr:MAG: fumarate reductase [Gracilibacter sp. BRH_c7a]
MFESKNEVVLKTDVLIIGGGSAGTMAALAARKKGLEVILVDKANINRSGCGAAGNDHFMAVLESGPDWDTPEAFLAWYKRLTQGLVDSKVVEKVFTSRIKGLVEYLENIGIQMRIDTKNNDFIRTKSFAQPGEYFINFDGRSLKPIVSKEAEEAGVKCVRQVYITDLIKQEERVIGAVGFNIRNGDSYIFEAPAVILATGNVSRMYRNPSGLPFNAWHSPYNNGSAQAMAYKAGADLKNMEFVNYTLTPKNFSASALNAIVGMGGYIVNSLGERYVLKYHEQGEQGPRWTMPWGTYWELKEGRGPCYFDVRHLSDEAIEHLLTHLLPVDKNTFMDYCNQKGLDLKKDLLEIQICEGQLPAFVGSVTGIHIDENCLTTVPGLYAAGGCAVSICNLAGSMAVGGAAGESAADEILRDRIEVKLDQEKIAELKARAFEPLKRANELEESRFEGKLHQIMADYVGIGRTKLGLETGLEELKKLNDLTSILGATDGHVLMRVHEAQDMLLLAELITKGALTREESRFGLSHYRGDYPDTNPEWHVSLHQSLKDGVPMMKKVAAYK